MKRVLALVDFTEHMKKVVDRAVEQVSAFGGELFLLHVVPPPAVVVDYAPIPVVPDEFEDRRRQLFELRDSLAAQGIKTTAEQYTGPVVDTIVAHIDPLAPDLVVMGSHGHGALYDLVVGSVTTGMVKRAGWPLLLVPGEIPAATKPALASKPARRSKARPAETPADIAGVPGFSV